MHIKRNAREDIRKGDKKRLRPKPESLKIEISQFLAEIDYA
jgi:hypothetical protein